MSASAYSVTNGSTVALMWTTPTGGADSYNLKYVLNNQYYLVKSGLTSRQYSFTFSQEGTYSFYVDSVNASGYTQSTIVNITVTHAYVTRYEGVHPHRAYKQCPCGDWYYVDGTTELENCITCCTPKKPSLLNIKEKYEAGESITFSWNNVDKANRYDFWLYKKNGNNWDVYEHTMRIEKGFSRTLPIGQYKCKLLAYNNGKWNADYSDYIYTESDPYYFSVNVKSVKITTQPKAVTASKNAKAKFTVAASGVGLKYQWQVKTSSKAAWKNTTITGYKTKTITVGATSARNGYQYRCVVTDEYGNKAYSNAAKLTVKSPKITTQPKAVTAAKNAKAKFTVAASGVGLKYQWQVKTSSKTSWKNTTITGYKTKTITVGATSARNGYQYRCVVTDEYGNKAYSNAAKLTVKSPKISTQPKSVTAAKNGKAKFTVAASGVGLKYQWQVKTSSKASWKNTTIAGYKTKTITVGATSARNGYQYRCVITDAAGNKVTSKTVKLTVKK